MARLHTKCDHSEPAKMSASLTNRSATREARSQSLFYRDLGASLAIRSPAFKWEIGSVGKATTAALWRENSGGAEHPPPPIFSLEDRIERSPDAPFVESLVRSSDSRFEEAKSPTRTPLLILGSRTPNTLSHGDTGAGYLFGSPAFQISQQHKSPGSPNWWSPFKEGQQSLDMNGGREMERDGGSPVSGVVQKPHLSAGLLTLPTMREIVKPEFQLFGSATENGDCEDDWVTVFGFGVEETNVVMRELEKCGTIVGHVAGPGGANWIHVQFQNKLDAQKALFQNGLQINGALIVGVKPLDPLQRQALIDPLDPLQRQALIDKNIRTVLPPRTPGKSILSTPGKQQSARSYYLQTPSGRSDAAGLIASPAKSNLSKIADLIFGL